MDLIKLKEAMNEAERFICRADKLLKQQNSVDSVVSYHCPKEQGAVKRASMDLTRALAELRKPRI